jgi:hypothetical protein
VKVSEITTETLREYLKTDEDSASLQLFLDGAKSYVAGYAGLDDEQMDGSDDIALCVLAVASDMYDQRQTQVGVNNSYINRLVDSMLFMHSRNLL